MSTSLLPEIRVGDVDTAFVFEIHDMSSSSFDPEAQCDPPILDVSAAAGAGEKVIHFQKPDQTVVTKDAVFTTDGTDGKIQYLAEAGFLDTPGQWKRQAKIVLGAGTWHTHVTCFTVHPSLA